MEPLWKLVKACPRNGNLFQPSPHQCSDVNPSQGVGGSTASLFALQGPENPRTASGGLYGFYSHC